jgi:uncharacterized membrane protein
VLLRISTTSPSPAGTPPGSYTITVSATTASLTHSSQIALIISGSGSSFDFALNNNSSTQTIQAGQTASYNFDVRPLDANTTFPQDVTLSCSSVPPLSTCSFTPAEVSPRKRGHKSGSARRNDRTNFRICADARSWLAEFLVHLASLGVCHCTRTTRAQETIKYRAYSAGNWRLASLWGRQWKWRRRAAWHS